MDSSGRAPLVLRGEMANLEQLRHALQSSAAVPSPTFVLIFQQHCVAPDECVLTEAKGLLSTTTWKVEDTTVFADVEGSFFVTSERILFVAKNGATQDFAIDAECIQLLAVSNDSVYIQIQYPEDEESAPMELTVTPVKTDDTSSTTSQQMFEALSRLVSMHPIPLDDDDDDDDGMMEDAIAAPPSVEGGAATEEDRDVMLERLDQMLVVPPEYEEHETTSGQFDDADEGKECDAQFEDADADDTLL